VKVKYVVCLQYDYNSETLCVQFGSVTE